MTSVISPWLRSVTRTVWPYRSAFPMMFDSAGQCVAIAGEEKWFDALPIERDLADCHPRNLDLT
jgi:hypothetical protein